MRRAGRTLALLTFAWALALPGAAGAAASDRSREGARAALDYGPGLGTLELRDDLLRPLRWVGVHASLTAGLDVETRRFAHRVDVDLGFAHLWNRYGHGGLAITQGVHYALVGEVFRRRKLRILAGGSYRYESLDAFYYDWDDSFLYWFTTHSLAPSVAFEHRLTHTLTLLTTVELPLVALMARPEAIRQYKVDPMPYLGRWPELTHRGLRLVGPGDLYAPTLRARLDKAYGRHFGLRATLDLAYRRALEPRGYRALAQRVVLELRHAF